jgi:alkaline phosphatase D
VATAGAGLAACKDEDWPSYPDSGTRDGGGDAAPDDRSFSFPQGVASGDPRPSSVMLWTRVQPEGGDGDVTLRLEVADSESFESPVVSETVQVGSDSDFTARVLVENLEPDTIYYYRFAAGGDRSRAGRTWTAPEPGADTPIRFAWASCQDYSAGFYGAYRRMLNDDQAAPASDQLRFILPSCTSATSSTRRAARASRSRSTRISSP